MTVEEEKVFIDYDKVLFEKVVLFEGEEYVVLKPELCLTASQKASRYADTQRLLILSVICYFTSGPLYYYILSYFGSLYNLFWVLLTILTVLFQIWYTRLLYKYLNNKTHKLTLYLQIQVHSIQGGLRPQTSTESMVKFSPSTANGGLAKVATALLAPFISSASTHSPNLPSDTPMATNVPSQNK